MDSDPERLLARIQEATGRLAVTAAALTDAQAREPSRLPGWSRGHVLTHIARNADGLGNLLVWARTGVETPQYPSVQAREDGIEAGARRPAAELAADVTRSATGFAEEAARVPADRLGRAGPRPERPGPPGLVHAVPAADRGGDPPRRPGRGIRAPGLARGVRRRRAGAGHRAARRPGRRPRLPARSWPTPGSASGSGPRRPGPGTSRRCPARAGGCLPGSPAGTTARPCRPATARTRPPAGAACPLSCRSGVERRRPFRVAGGPGRTCSMNGET